VWVVAGVAVVAALAGMVVARTGTRHAAVSAPSRSSAAAASPVAAARTPAAGSEVPWPSAVAACGSTVELPQIRLAGRHADVHGRLLVGGAGLRLVTLGGAMSGPPPGLPGHGWLVTSVVAGPGAGCWRR